MRLPYRIFIVLGFLLLACLPLEGDIVYFKSGSFLEGRILHQDENVVKLETIQGVQTIDRSLVQAIKRGPHILDEYYDRLKRIRKNDAQGYFELYEWCKQSKLKRQAEEAFGKARGIDPNHDGVNLELGNIKYKGKWYTPEQLEEKGIRLYKGKWMSEEDIMKEKNMVEYEGRWMTPLEKAGLEMAKVMREELKMQVEILHTDHTFILSRFPKEVAETFGEKAEQAWILFFSLMQPDEKEEKWIRKVVIYLMDNPRSYSRFFDEFLVKKGYISEDEEEFYRNCSGYPNYFPRPFILSCRSVVFPDLDTLHALTVHNMAHLLLWRFKMTLPVYPWFDEAFAHYMEERIMRYSRIVCLYPDGHDENQVFVRGFTNSVEWRQQLKGMPDNPRASSFRKLMDIPQGCFNSIDLCKGWSILSFLFERHPVEVRKYVDRMMVAETQEMALEEAFGWTPEELEERWKAYIQEKYP